MHIENSEYSERTKKLAKTHVDLWENRIVYSEMTLKKEKVA